MGIYTNNENELCCPLCGDSNTHLDRAAMAARVTGEDGPIVEVGILQNGVVTDETGHIPPSSQVGEGRRTRIALFGWCELCNGQFALLFTQHKGVTLLESVDLNRKVIDDYDWQATDA
jgi:hypothetical protein